MLNNMCVVFDCGKTIFEEERKDDLWEGISKEEFSWEAQERNDDSIQICQRATGWRSEGEKMKDWEWFALGLIPFAGAPVQVIRYLVTGQTSSPAQLAAGLIAGQGVAYGLQKAGFYKVNEALMLYRIQSLGFVEEGWPHRPGTGYKLIGGKEVKGVRNIRGSGVGWKATFPMRMASPIMMAMFIGTIANQLSTASGHRRHAYYMQRHNAIHVGHNPDAPSYI